MTQASQAEVRPIFGMSVNVFASQDHAARFVEHRLDAGLRTFCVAMNPEKLYRARRDANLRNVLASADMRLCDGVGVSLASRILCASALPRCTGIDLFLALVALAERRQWTIFLLGASPEANRGARNALKRRFPLLRIAGTRDGFFSDSKEVIGEINRSEPELLFVAMGSPRQEFWIAENRAALHPRFCMGVGGSLDVLAGVAKRAPTICRKTGTEWLFRLLSDPRRAKRQIALPLFAWAVVKAAISGDRQAAAQ